MVKDEKAGSTHRCTCGLAFSARSKPDSSVLCPRCGRIVLLRTKSSDKQTDFENLIEAAAEVLAEGEPPISGAR